MMVLVSGGAGYIGSVAVEYLIDSGNKVVVFDDLSQGHRESVHPEAHFVQGDLARIEEIDSVMKEYRPRAVMHFAAKSLVGESMLKPFLYLGGNVRNGLNLMESAVAHNVERFILSSTANLYDKPETIPIDENAAIIPGSPYGESKYILERMLHWLKRTTPMNVAVLRYFNAAGATRMLGEAHVPETHLIPLVLQVALGQRDSIQIFGQDYDTIDGTCVRDYVHVADLAQAHILALNAIESTSCTYNLGNGHGFSVKQVIDAAREITGHPIPCEYMDRRPGDVATLVASSEAIRSDLKWKPQFPDIYEIIKTAWEWHQTHPDGYNQSQ